MAELSTNAAALLAWTKRLVAGGGAAPSDFQIAKRFGLRTPDDAVTLLDELRSAGLIEVERTSNGRNIYVTDAAPIALPAPVSRRAADLVGALMPLAPTEPVRPRPRPAPIFVVSEQAPLPAAAEMAPAPETPAAPPLPPPPPPSPSPPSPPPIQEEPVMPEIAAEEQAAPPPFASFPTPAHARVERLLEELTRCADAGLPCPTDKQLSRLLGFRGDSSIHTPMHKLRVRGDIVIELIPGRGRIVTICATGRATAPVGRAAVGHYARLLAQPAVAARFAPAGKAARAPATPLQSPFAASVAIIDGAPTLTVHLSLDPGPAREFREFLAVPLDEMNLVELLGTAAIALRDLQSAQA